MEGKIVHKKYECPADGSPLAIDENIKIYTMKSSPEFEVNASGQSSTVSFAARRAKEEAWGVAVDKAFDAKRGKKL